MRPRNPDPFGKWNDPLYRDDPLAPWNDPIKRDDPSACWNDPFGDGTYREDVDLYR